MIGETGRKVVMGAGIFGALFAADSLNGFVVQAADVGGLPAGVYSVFAAIGLGALAVLVAAFSGRKRKAVKWGAAAVVLAVIATLIAGPLVEATARGVVGLAIALAGVVAIPLRGERDMLPGNLK